MKVDFHSTAGKIAEICGGEIITGNPDTIINTITSDSREIGKNNLFIPIIGEKFDGHEFIKELLLSRSITSFLTMRGGFEQLAANNNITAIKCNDTLQALGVISSNHRDCIDPELIGITGTNGKTTTKELVYAILKGKYSSLKNEKNYNNEIGVPFTLLGLTSSHKIAVVELGMNHPGELKRLSMVSKPDIAVIVNIGEGHLEFLGSIENVAAAKSEIMYGMEKGSTIIINRDTECFELIKEKILSMGFELKTFGMTKGADIYPDEYRLLRDSIELLYKGEPITVPLYGIHNIYNVIAAIAVAEEYDISPGEIDAALSDFKNINGRSQIIDKGYIVIDDSYNSNPLSSRFALMSANLIFSERRKIAVLSDMKELGESSAFYHKEAGRMVGENGFDILCVWGEMSQAYINGSLKSGMKKENVFRFTSKDEMIGYLLDNITDNDVILVKGSRSMKMEEVVNSLVI